MSPRKNLLILTYYWPPAGGPGVQRWLKNIKYLSASHNISIIIPENATYPSIDDSLLSEVPEGIKLIKIPIKEPSSIGKLFFKKTTTQLSKGVISSQKKSWVERLLLFIRGNFFIPDARVGWSRSVANYLINSYSDTPDVFITTGPPHSLHLAGLKLKAKKSWRWIADFRDPWTEISYHKDLMLTPKAERTHKALEYAVLTQADEVVVTSSVTQRKFQELAQREIRCITNGFDRSINEHPEPAQGFIVAHIGSFLSERNPPVLWEVLNEMLHEISGFKDDLQLCLAGNVSKPVLESIAEFELEDYLINRGYLSYEASFEQMQAAAVLLLLEIDRLETAAIIPGKLFEYLAAQRPVLAIGPKQAAYEAIMEATTVGSCFQPEQKQAIKAYLVDAYQAFKAGRLYVKSKDVLRYHRKNLALDWEKLF